MELNITHVQIPDHLDGEGGYQTSSEHWDNSTLFESVKDLGEFDLPLCVINISHTPWDMDNFRWMLYHLKRIEKCDFKYPVILSPDGRIIDGWHRVAKAIMDNKLTIKAVRLNVMPESDRIINKE